MDQYEDSPDYATPTQERLRQLSGEAIALQKHGLLLMLLARCELEAVTALEQHAEKGIQLRAEPLLKGPGFKLSLRGRKVWIDVPEDHGGVVVTLMGSAEPKRCFIPTGDTNAVVRMSRTVLQAAIDMLTAP